MKIPISKYWVIFFFFLVSLINIIPLLHLGIPFQYDWLWPVFSMQQFWVGLTGTSIQGIFSALSKTGPAIIGLFGLVHFPPSIFLKLFILAVHFTAGYGFYCFIKTKVKSEAVAVISGIAYAFSPYIFIRTIIGFTWSMVAYALLPIFLLKFWQPKKRILDFIIIGFLLSLIFGQTQAGILTSLVVTVNLVIARSPWRPRQSIRLLRRSHTPRNDGEQLEIVAIKNYFFAFVSLFVFALPWMVVMLFHKTNLSTVSGGAVTTLNFIASLPHSLRNFLMLSDHHITYYFFYPLAHDKLFIIGWLIVWFVAFCAIFNKKNRELVWTFITSCLIVLPFIKGPLGIFGGFYVWFYNRVPQITIFRETYHFEFLYAISLCVLFAIGLDWLWQKIDCFKPIIPNSKFIIPMKTGLTALLAGSAIFIIAPYLTFDYAGYLKMQKIPDDYTELHNFYEENKDFCNRIYYPPGTGFVYFKGDKSRGASNSDLIASSLGVPYLIDGTSVLNLPSNEMFFRNELVSQFYEKEDSGQFTSLMQEGGIDCVVLRLDTESKYDQASNLWQEKNPEIVKKWNQTDLLSLTKSKLGLEEVKQFGDDIHIFKVSSQSSVVSSQKNIQTFPTNYKLQTTDYLPLTDWANNYAYYKDGWSRGRYDFWRKHLFTQLRQDFIYTDKTNSTLNGQIDKKGDYELWARYLTGGAPGNFQLSISNYQYNIEKGTGEGKFIWKDLGNIRLNGQTEIEIRNIVGENAIADIVLESK